MRRALLEKLQISFECAAPEVAKPHAATNHRDSWCFDWHKKSAISGVTLSGSFNYWFRPGIVLDGEITGKPLTEENARLQYAKPAAISSPSILDWRCLIREWASANRSGAF